MILIADGGSTKTNWCLTDGSTNTYFDSEGYNPYFVNTTFIISSLEKSLPEALDGSSVSAVHFYGAGCTKDKAPVVQQALRQVFSEACCFVESDLLGAARALLGDQPGFAAILGTGTNTGLFDGNGITFQIDSLGFIMGDEGSGGYLGKKMLGDYIRNVMPSELRLIFDAAFQLPPQELISRIYTQPLPNRFCASFAPFIREHIRHPYMHQLVRESFGEFFNRLVRRYPDYQSHSFNCVGSVAWFFADTLREIAAEYEMNMGRIMQSPIDGLAGYHFR